jgi:hypothetical protein
VQQGPAAVASKAGNQDNFSIIIPAKTGAYKKPPAIGDSADRRKPVARPNLRPYHTMLHAARKLS